MLDRHPVKTQSSTSGFLFLIGDLTAQRYEAKLDRDRGIDTSQQPWVDLLRLAACTSFGLFVLGPCGHHWYAWLDRFINARWAARTFKNVGMKVLLDTTIFNPIFLIVFFSSVSLMEGLTFKDIGAKLYRDFVPSYVVDCSIWPPIQTLNFRFVPVKFQLLVVNLGCYFDDVFLSYVQHNGMPRIFQRVERAWLDFIDGADGEEAAGANAAADAAPLLEVMPCSETPSGKSKGKKEPVDADCQEIVRIVPADRAHPRQAHVHAPRAVPLAHHHTLPRVLSEAEHKLPRAKGVNTRLVEQLDKGWTTQPTGEHVHGAAAKACPVNHDKDSASADKQQ